MTTLYIDRRNAEIDVEGDTVVVRAKGERRGTVPLKPLERVVIKGAARLTTRFLARLAENGTGLLVLSGLKHEPKATLLGRPRGDTDLRITQYDLLKYEPARAEIARNLVTAKLTAQMGLLKRCQEIKGTTLIAERAYAQIAGLLEEVNRIPHPRPRLRGLEGAAAAAYFPAYATFFAPSLNFKGRNKRPPRDPVNACLSLGYTLLHFEAVREAAANGLDPMVGIYHDLAPGRESLASDLSEPLRPAIDRFVFGMFYNRTLRPEDFSSTEAMGCRLKKTARRRYYKAYEEAATIYRPILARLSRDLAAAIRTFGRTGCPAAISVENGQGGDQPEESGDG